MASISFDFTQADGDATGWSSVGVTLPQVVGNKLSTPATGTTYAGTYASGLTLTTYAEITVDFDLDGGGANVYLVNGSLNGYGIGWGTATGTRLVRLDAGAPTNVDTDATLGGGASGPHSFKFTRTSAGLMKGYVDAVEYLSATDTTYTTAATILVAYDAASGTSDIDNLVVSDTAAGATYIAPRIVVRRQAVNRAGSW